MGATVQALAHGCKGKHLPAEVSSAFWGHALFVFFLHLHQQLQLLLQGLRALLLGGWGLLQALVGGARGSSVGVIVCTLSLRAHARALCDMT